MALTNESSIIRELKKHYTTDFFASTHDRDPFKVLIACLISLRTKDEVMMPAAQRLFRLASTPKTMKKLPAAKIAKTIYPAGFYNRKAITIKETAKLIDERYGGIVPDSFDELIKIKGVGRKTANIVLVFGYNKPAIPVDVHVHHIANRLGWVKTKTPDETEHALTTRLSKKYWLDINELFVKHGQQICLSVSPYCSRCMISKWCEKQGVGRSR